MNKHYDVIIIGSGIAGMTAAIYLKRSGIDTLIIEENAPGGQLNKINSIENYPGFIKTDGPTLAAELFNQVAKALQLNIKVNPTDTIYASYFDDILKKVNNLYN